jgi:hypothetical protein
MLSEEAVQTHLGLLNGDIKEQLQRASSASERLLGRIDNRQFTTDVSVLDEEHQDALYDALVDRVESSWGDTASDTYHADYDIGLADSDRNSDHEDSYRTLLYRKATYDLVPVSLINLWVGGTRTQFYTMGIQYDYDVDPPSFHLSPLKVLLFSIFSLSLLGAFLTHPSVYGTVLVLQGVGYPVYLVASVVFVVTGIGWSFAIYRAKASEEPSVITVIGDDDTLNTTFLAVLAHSISYEGSGEVLDPVYTELSTQLFEDLTLGSSITYSVEFENGQLVRLVGLSAASYERMDDEVRQLLDQSDGIIGILSEEAIDIQSSFETFESVAESFSGQTAILTNHSELANTDIDYPIYEISLGSLRKAYLNEDDESNEQVVSLIQNVR